MSYKAYQLSRQAREPGKTLLVITASEKAASAFRRDLEFFSAGGVNGEVRLFPAPDALPYTHLAAQQDIWIDRLNVLYKLTCNEPIAIVAPVEAVLRRCPPEWIFKRYRRTIRLHDVIDIEELCRWLSEAGYINQPLVEDEGAFSRRGGIVDIFPPTSDRPARIELDGDEISSLRSFDPSTQRSSFSVSSATLIPVRNVILNEETTARALGVLKGFADEAGVKPTERRELAEAIQRGFYAPAVETLMPIFYEATASLFDYLPRDAQIFVEDEIEVAASAEKLIRRLETAHAEARHIEKIIEPERIYDSRINHVAQTFRSADFGRSKDLRYNFFPPLKKGERLTPVIRQIQNWQKKGLRVIITSHTTTQAERILDLIRWHNIASEITDRPFAEIIPPLKGGGGGLRSVVWIMIGALSSGFISEEDKLAILTDEDIFGAKVPRRAAFPPAIETFTDFAQLCEGDYITHKEHGIGRYLGLKNLEIGSAKNDFLLLEYLGGDKLYLPVWRVNLINRYIGAGGGAVVLDRLGGTRWTKTQRKVTAAIRTMALELLKIYAARKTNPSFAFSARDQMLEEFEAAFPYDETPDQWQAIEDTLSDMRKAEPADRLICGDVGYGKTEVAMRAAFKAVSDGKQAAILVPTTVLAFQHYENFVSRFSSAAGGWPVKLEMLSRFRSRTEQKHIVSGLSRGTVNIVIGTHRLLQRDVRFHDLGLLIIDEEHRFGVAHKERIRKLRTTVDTITMSATPIPRTLHMSLSGIRDISIINTPPADRLAIRTYVACFDEDLIRSAVMAELSRGGQIFFVHNRVETIQKMHERLGKLLPEAKIVVAHGQMDEALLEEAMVGFVRREADMLLCTAIIESGLDIPSANTIIINRADTFGLAQLYQIRGRVGRSNVQAYAYLLIPCHSRESGNLESPHGIPAYAGMTISTNAQKRLAALQRYTALGSGFQIAMHDLEIRGTGNLLGPQQSGHINAIGYEMYTELLERMIRQFQGQPEPIRIETEITIPVPAYIPTDYVEDEGQRLVLYRRLASVASLDALDGLASEITDRYGKMPELVKNLLGIVEIKILAREPLIESIQFDGGVFAYKFHNKTPVRPETILKMVAEEPGHLSFKQPSTLLIKDSPRGEAAILSAIKTHLRRLV